MALSVKTEMELCLILEHRLRRAQRQVAILNEMLWDDGFASHSDQKRNVYETLVGVREAYKALTGDGL